jgi:sarcosine oxidase subunit gamma
MPELARAMRHGPLAERAPASVGLCRPAARFIFRGPAEAARLCGRAFGCDLPFEACRAKLAGERAALWLGPDEWLLLSNDADETAALLAAIEAGLVGMPHSLVDVSHRQVGVEVSGLGAATLINAGCPLDLDLRAFPIGMSTRTVLAKADITLWRLAEDRFRIEVARSFSPYLLGFLGSAAAA